jgi:flagellar basal body-associated protein FliL
MKKLLIPMMIVAIIIAIWQQSKDDKNIYIMIIAIVIFMYGMMRLSAKTPSKNQDKEDENV